MPTVMCGAKYEDLPVRVDDISNRPDSRWICSKCIRAEDEALKTELYRDHPRSWAAANHQPYHWHVVVADDARRLSLHERVARLPEWLLAEALGSDDRALWMSPEEWQYEYEDVEVLLVSRSDDDPVERIEVAQEQGIRAFLECHLRVLEAVAAHWRSVRKDAGIDNDTDEWPGVQA